MRLMERDITILKEVGRWKITLGRHIKELAGFSGDRTCDNRLKILVDNNYLQRNKFSYGIPYIYSLTHKSRIFLNLNKRAEKIRLDQLRHDIIVLDTVIYLLKTEKLSLSDFISEKEMHQKDGFGARQHKPDFIYQKNNQAIAVEIELSLKSLERLEKNAKNNFLNYDLQVWIIEKNSKKIHDNLIALQEKYPNISLKYVGDIS